jgi:hypothetical protein
MLAHGLSLFLKNISSMQVGNVSFGYCYSLHTKNHALPIVDSKYLLKKWLSHLSFNYL